VDFSLQITHLQTAITYALVPQLLRFYFCVLQNNYSCSWVLHVFIVTVVLRLNSSVN